MQNKKTFEKRVGRTTKNWEKNQEKCRVPCADQIPVHYSSLNGI